MSVKSLGRRICDVFVLGTIHQFHTLTPGYTLFHLEGLLEAFGPDLIAVEIRPEDWAKGDLDRGPYEMGRVAVPWAQKKAVPVVPVDWWEDGMPDEYRLALAELQASAEGRSRLERVEEREKEALGLPFPELCRTIERVHSPEVQARFRAVHDIEAAAFGEGPLNKYWRTRNRIMAERVTAAIRDRGARRAVAVVGCEHKYAIEDQLVKGPDIRLTRLDEFLKTPVALTPEQSLSFDRLFVFQKVDGPEANTHPDRADLTGVQPAIERLLAAGPGDPEVIYYRGLYHFLKRELDLALRDFARASQDEATLLLGRVRLWEIARIRMGQVYDMRGERENALAEYGAVTVRGYTRVTLAKRFAASPYVRSS